MKEELTGQLVEYDQCRRLAENLRQRAEQTALFVRQPLVLEWDDTYALHHPAQMLVDSWQALNGRAVVRPAQPTPQQFEPVVAAPQVSVVSRVVHILRRLVGGRGLPAWGSCSRPGNPAVPTSLPFWRCWSWCGAAGCSWMTGER